MKKIRVAVNGYGVIGKRMADAISLQDDMTLVGICDVSTDWRIKMAVNKEYTVYATTDEVGERMVRSGIPIAGSLDALLQQCEVIVDCTPKNFSAANTIKYKKEGVKFIVQGGDKHETTGHSFTAEINYESAVNRESTRVVSCNTTSMLRTLGALNQTGLLQSARGTLLRRATDPWESHLNGMMNTLLPEEHIPSHQAPDAKTVLPELDLITTAIKVPETLSHLHSWVVKLTRKADREEVLQAFRKSSRIAFINYSDGLQANNVVKELMLDMGRPRGDMYEVALWEDMLTVIGDELYYSYIVDNQAIVIPENIDAIRALTGVEKDSNRSISKTDQSLGIRSKYA